MIHLSLAGRFPQSLRNFVRTAVVAALCLGPSLFCLYGDQKVHWKETGPLDRERGAQVEVVSDVEINAAELAYMKQKIPQRVNNVLKGDENGRKVYYVKVTITRYDEGNAFLRFLIIGLGQMYMDGTVEVREGDEVIRSGWFKKNVRLGGLLGAFAKPRLMTDHIGVAVQNALNEKASGEK